MDILLWEAWWKQLCKDKILCTSALETTLCLTDSFRISCTVLETSVLAFQPYCHQAQKLWKILKLLWCSLLILNFVFKTVTFPFHPLSPLKCEEESWLMNEKKISVSFKEFFTILHEIPAGLVSWGRNLPEMITVNILLIIIVHVY